MSYTKIFVIMASTLLFLFVGKPVAFAQQDIEPDFSNFDDPDAKPVNKAKVAVEAEPPCGTCSGELPKTKNQEQLKTVIKETKKQATVKAVKEKTPPKRKQESCVTCGRKKVADKTYLEKATGESGWNQFPEIMAYSNSSQVENMIAWATSHHFSSSQGYCYRYVKQALCGAERPKCKPGALVKEYLKGNPVFADLPSSVPQNKRIGSNAIKALEAEGFKNLLADPTTADLIKNPASAPKGAILIYAGGKNGGHIEIKTSERTKGSYISDFSEPNSILKNELAGRASHRYQLVGVMIKPMGS